VHLVESLNVATFFPEKLHPNDKTIPVRREHIISGLGRVNNVSGSSLTISHYVRGIFPAERSTLLPTFGSCTVLVLRQEKCVRERKREGGASSRPCARKYQNNKKRKVSIAQAQ
jgi:hypothetical protein